MGLFKKKEKEKGICMICGNEGNALKTVDNEFLCDECFEKCRGEIAVLGKGLKKLTSKEVMNAVELCRDSFGNFVKNTLIQIVYLGGHPLFNREEMICLLIRSDKIVVKAFGTGPIPIVDVFEVSYSDIKSVSIEKEEEVIRRYTATRIALFGPFALAMQKAELNKKEYLIIECNDFILSFDKNDEASATVYKNLIEYRKNNGIRNVRESEVEKNKITNPLEQIKTLKELLDMEAITQEEFDVKKKELLNL